MLPIPGKTCGSCTMCCKVLEIDHFEKPAGDWCGHCVKTGGCEIYAKRPHVCREFECEWMGERGLSPKLRPDLVGTVLIDCAESDEYRAVCDPASPLDWLHPLMFKHLVSTAKAGRVVVARAGLKAWRVYASGHYTPTV